MLVGEEKEMERMNERILEVVKEELAKAGFDNAEFTKNDCAKVNGTGYHGVAIKIPDRNTAPTLNMDNLLKKVSANPGVPIKESIALDIQNIICALCDPFEFNIEWFCEYSNVRERLFLKVGGVQENADFLTDTPHFLMEDLAFYVAVMVEAPGEGIASVTVRNNILGSWGITQEQLFADAKYASEKNMPLCVGSMFDVIRDMDAEVADELEANRDVSEPTMLFCSNRMRVEGAAVVAYPSFYEKVRERLGLDSFYVIPSSRHEVLVVPKTATTLSDEICEAIPLRDMVAQVNDNEVSKEDRLSYELYKFENGLFGIAGKRNINIA